MKDLAFLTQNLIAHRGFFNQEKIPENSMLAFQKAIENHYIIELDLHLLKDGKIAVFHDDNLQRMTGKNKSIKDCTYAEIQNLKLLNTNEKIPLFEEVLKYVAGKVPILIELKYDVKTGLLEKEVWKLLKDYSGEYAIQSFNPFSIWWFKKNAYEVVRGQLAKKDSQNKFFNIKNFILSNLLLNGITDPDFISYDVKSIDAILKKNHKNKKIIAWTVKDKKHMRNM